jgi:hypothetical protein
MAEELLVVAEVDVPEVDDVNPEVTEDDCCLDNDANAAMDGVTADELADVVILFADACKNKIKR